MSVVRNLHRVAFKSKHKNKTGNVFKVAFLVLFVHSFFVINSCRNSAKTDLTKVFRYNEDASVSTLDPAFVKSQSEIWLVSQLYNGLVRIDDSLKLQPDLAYRWEISENGTVYTFHLRPDLKFYSEGKEQGPCSANDVVYSFYRILNPKTASPGSWIFNDKVLYPCGFDSLALLLPEQKPFFAPNDSTVVIRLNKSFPAFIQFLAMPYCYVVKPKESEKWGKEFRSHPCGTGPFYLKLWDEDSKLIFRKNNSYFEKDNNGNQLPYLEAINIDFIKNKQTAFLKFLQGDYDFFNGIDGNIKDVLLNQDGQLNPKLQNDVVMLKNDFLNTEYLGFMIDKEAPKFKTHPIQKLKVRQALSYAINRKKLIKYLRNDVGVAGYNGIIPPVLLGEEKVNGSEFNISLSRKLLAEAGFAGGQNLPQIELNVTADYLDMALFIKDQWQQIGVTTKVNVHPGGFLRQLRNKMEINLFRGSWIADYPDPENYLSMFYSKNFSPAGPNYTHYSNQQFDKLYESISKTTDDTERKVLYSKMDQLMMQECPVIILFYDQSIRLTHKNVSNLKAHPMNWLDLRTVKKLN